MLIISRRDGFLGEKYGGKKLKDADTRTFKIELTEVLLERDELGAVLGESHAYVALYDTSRTPHRPYLACIKALEMKTAWEGAHVLLWYEMGSTKVELKKARLTKIKLELREGGETALSLTVEGEPPLDKRIAELIERVGTGIECEIRAEQPAAQEDLPLSRFGEGEQAQEGEKKPRGNNKRLNA